MQRTVYLVWSGKLTPAIIHKRVGQSVNIGAWYVEKNAIYFIPVIS